MRAVIQRVTGASVAVDGKTVGECSKGYMFLLGVMNGDSEREADLLAMKTAMLRVFEDENGKMNKSILDIGGEILCISQFTLCADVKKGNRPSFTPSAPPAEANALYEYFVSALLKEGVKKVDKGVFGADMQVSLVNDGPVTIVFDTDEWANSKIKR